MQNYTVAKLNYGRKVYDFMRWDSIAFGFSILLFISATLLMFIRGFNWGLDFTGGTVIEVNLAHTANLDKIRDIIKKAGFTTLVIQNFGSTSDIRIRLAPILPTVAVESQKIHTSNINQEIGNKISTIIKESIDNSATVKSVEFVGPSVGDELAYESAIALLIALLSILIYVGIRFEWRLALGAIIALCHDITITLGILSLYDIEINLIIVASLMSIIGYSLNDSIVVSDRIRENFRKIHSGTTYEIINVSITQTLSRTIMTSIIIFVMVLILYIFGGTLLKDFSLTMLIGIVIGTLSSIYVSSALAFRLGLKREHMLQKKVRKECDDQSFNVI